MLLGAWLRRAAASLAAAGRDAPRLCAELLAARVLHCERVKLLIHTDQRLSSTTLAELDALLERRLGGEPLAYILGQREFYGRMFAVTPATLIPRPETEHLVEAALGKCPSGRLLFADMGTGSGCVAVTLLAERPAWSGIAVDLSMNALHIAAKNAHEHDVLTRLAIACADMRHPICKPGSLQLVVSNPPYVSRPEYQSVQDELLFEPEQALVPGGHGAQSPLGMECLSPLITQAEAALASGGWLCLEHGWQQAPLIAACLPDNTWKNINIIHDLSQNPRITLAQKV